MNPKRYVIAIVAATLTLVSAMWLLAYWLQPVYGDLARIGGHAERDYGWNLPMREFNPLAATWGGTRYERPVDILVLGDSFANLRPHMQWQNWLAAKTGWRIHTLDKHHIDLDELIASPAYRANPPRVVIWNTIERDLKDEYSDNDGHCGRPLPPSPVAPLPATRPTAAPPLDFMRPLGANDLNLGFARIWLWKALLRRATGTSHDETRLLRLKRDDLFTSRAANGLLIYHHDLNKQSWRDADFGRIRCSFAAMAGRFEANGATRFVTALAPDKSSAYRPWLVDPARLPESRLPALLHEFPVPDARLDRVLEQAIARGMKDVYMPDDTHWGTIGHVLAADAILGLLRAQSLTR
jgi:hypothetical protein